MMHSDDYEITIEDAQDIARWVVSADKRSKPLIGKEDELLETLLRAQRVHTEALDLDRFRRDHVQPTAKLRNALQKALDALNDTPVNLALFDPDLDERYADPNSERDLQGLLRRALKHLKKEDEDKNEVEGEILTLMNRQDQDGKVPRAIRSHPEKISRVGIRAVVEVLSDFWNRETGLPFSDDFEKPLNEHSEEGTLEPKGLASKFVCYTARLIDPNYTAETCSNAMRPR